MLNRRVFLKRIGASVLGAPMINLGRDKLFAGSATQYSARAIELVGRSVVIDMLGLLTLDWKKLAKWEADPSTFDLSDFQKLKESGITAFHPAVALDGNDPYGTAIRWIADLNFLIAKRPEYFTRIDCSRNFDSLKQEGKIGILVGMQNADHFRTVEDVAVFYKLGQRVSQLTYNIRNRLGFGCAEPRDEGLTEYGVGIIREMNRAGMAIDVSHAGLRTTLDAFEASTKPVLITHSNCRALVPRQGRCEPDEIIRRMVRRGSVMGITGIQVFVRKDGAATIENVLDHFDHVVKLAGVEHLGVGSDSDLDGRDHLLHRIGAKLDIPGLNHPRRMFDLTDGLIRRKYTDRDIELILGANFKRVLAEIWSV